MGILYCIYRRDFNRKYSADLYKRSIYKTWSINKDYIGQRYKIYYSILKSLYSRIRNQGNNIYNIPSTDGQINKKVKLDTKIIPKVLY